MRDTVTDRGFELVTHDVYPPREEGGKSVTKRLVQQSSAAKYMQPGSSYLWIGDDFHLNEAQVRGLRDRLTRWLKTGYLSTAKQRKRSRATPTPEDTPDA